MISSYLSWLGRIFEKNEFIFGGFQPYKSSVGRPVGRPRVSVQGVKSLGGHFACLCRGFEFYKVKKKKKLLLFFKKKMEILLHFLSFL